MAKPRRSTAKQAPALTGARLLVVEARFYDEICDELCGGAIAAIERAGATWERVAVPGEIQRG